LWALYPTSGKVDRASRAHIYSVGCCIRRPRSACDRSTDDRGGPAQDTRWFDYYPAHEWSRLAHGSGATADYYHITSTGYPICNSLPVVGQSTHWSKRTGAVEVRSNGSGSLKN